MKTKYIDIVMPFLKKAGNLALNGQTLITGCNKCDGSIVTETDIKISKLFKTTIEKNFVGHYILDEETALKEGNLKEKIKNHEYIWIIDPIDGTKTYFHGSTWFAIALSLYKNLKPVFSIIYLPAFATIIYNDIDEGKVFHIKNAFKRNEVKLELFFEKNELNKNSLVHFPVKSAAKYIKNYKFSFIDGYSAYIYAVDVLTNVAQGAFLKDNVSMWDLYSTLPIANKMGIKIYNIENSNELKEIDFSLFNDNLKVKNIWLICHPCYKNELMSILI